MMKQFNLSSIVGFFSLIMIFSFSSSSSLLEIILLLISLCFFSTTFDQSFTYASSNTTITTTILTTTTQQPQPQNESSSTTTTIITSEISSTSSSTVTTWETSISSSSTIITSTTAAISSSTTTTEAPPQPTTTTQMTTATSQQILSSSSISETKSNVSEDFSTTFTISSSTSDEQDILADQQHTTISRTFTQPFEKDPANDDFLLSSPSISSFVEASSTASIAFFLISSTTPPVLLASMRNVMLLRSSKCANFLVTDDDDRRLTPKAQHVDLNIALHPTRLRVKSSNNDNKNDNEQKDEGREAQKIAASLSKQNGVTVFPIQYLGIFELLSNYQGVVIAAGFIAFLPTVALGLLIIRIVSICTKSKEKPKTFLRMIEIARYPRIVCIVWCFLIGPAVACFVAVFAYRDRREVPNFLISQTVSNGIVVFLMSIAIFLLLLPFLVAFWACFVAGRTLKLVYDPKRDYAEKQRKRNEEFQKANEDKENNNQLFSVLTDLEKANELEREREEQSAVYGYNLPFSERFAKTMKHWTAYWCIAIDGRDYDYERDKHVRRFGVFFEHTNSPATVIFELLCLLVGSVALGYSFSVIWRPSNFVSLKPLIDRFFEIGGESAQNSVTAWQLREYFSALFTCQLSCALASAAEFLPLAFYVWRRPILKRIDSFALIAIISLNMTYSALNTTKFYQFSTAASNTLSFVDHRRPLAVATFIDESVLPTLSALCQAVILVFAIIYLIFGVGRFRELRRNNRKKKERRKVIERIRIYGGAEEVNLNDLLVLDEEEMLGLMASSSSSVDHRNGTSTNHKHQTQVANENLEELLIQTGNREGDLNQGDNDHSLDEKYFRLQHAKQRIVDRENMNQQEQLRKRELEAQNQDPFHEFRIKKQRRDEDNDDDDENENDNRDTFDYDALEYFCNSEEDKQSLRMLFSETQKRTLTTNQTKCVRLLQHFDPLSLCSLPRLFQDYQSNSSELLRQLSFQYCGTSEPPIEIVLPSSSSSKPKINCSAAFSSSSSPPGDYRQPSSIVQSACREQVKEIFEKCDPQVSQSESMIDELMRQYRGHELDLLYKLEMRYGYFPNSSSSSTTAQTSSNQNKNYTLDDLEKPSKRLAIENLDILRARVAKMKSELDSGGNEKGDNTSSLSSTKNKKTEFLIELARKMIEQYDQPLFNNTKAVSALLSRFSGREEILVETLERKYSDGKKRDRNQENHNNKNNAEKETNSFMNKKNKQTASDRYFLTNGFESGVPASRRRYVDERYCDGEDEDDEEEDLVPVKSARPPQSETSKLKYKDFALAELLAETSFKNKKNSSKKLFQYGDTALPMNE